VREKLRRNALFGIVRVESHAISELQIVDVLLGSVGYAFKLKYNNQSPTRAKLAILKHIQSKLGISTLSESIRRRKSGGYFEIKEFSK
jgi:hypothetical protein